MARLETILVGMRLALTIATSLTLIWAQAVAAQATSGAEAHGVLAELQASHIQANVPDEPAFSEFLQRDLNSFFTGRGLRSPAARFELLRHSATQSGAAYPKFYLWVRVQSTADRFTSGAVRVAAVERQRFDVTDFLSASEIRADPGRVRSVFPGPLVQAIIDRASSDVPRD